jgi:hypothetical protein
LNAILGWLRLRREGLLTEEKRVHAIDVIERNAQALNQLVGDLLDISRVITGKIRISASQVDLGNVVEMAIEGVRPAAEAKQIDLAVDLDGNNAVMRGDGDRLQQAVWNLVANAVKFTPKNGAVKVRLRRVDSDLDLTVEDNGAARQLGTNNLPDCSNMAASEQVPGRDATHGSHGVPPILHGERPIVVCAHARQGIDDPNADELSWRWVGIVARRP